MRALSKASNHLIVGALDRVALLEGLERVAHRLAHSSLSIPHEIPGIGCRTAVGVDTLTAEEPWLFNAKLCPRLRKVLAPQVKRIPWRMRAPDA
jgi:hypothetical protein